MRTRVEVNANQYILNVPNSYSISRWHMTYTSAQFMYIKICNFKLIGILGVDGEKIYDKGQV